MTFLVLAMSSGAKGLLFCHRKYFPGLLSQKNFMDFLSDIAMLL